MEVVPEHINANQGEEKNDNQAEDHEVHQWGYRLGQNLEDKLRTCRVGWGRGMAEKGMAWSVWLGGLVTNPSVRTCIRLETIGVHVHVHVAIITCTYDVLHQYIHLYGYIVCWSDDNVGYMLK